MIIHVVDDLMQSPARVLVNAVNTVGAMGKGIAREFKLCYPAMFENYRDLCQRGAFEVGQLHLYRTPHKWVLNFPTKQHWRSHTQIEDIESGLQTFVRSYAEQGITSVSFPRLGCGAGGLDWDNEVRPLMDAYLSPLPITIYIHEYDQTDPFIDTERSVRTVRAWLEGDPQTVSFDKFWRDISRLLRNQTRFETHNGVGFGVGRDKKRRGRHLVIKRDDQPRPVFLSQSSLADLWTYIHNAGYTLPLNLPTELHDHTEIIIALFGALDYLQPVHLYDEHGKRYVGLRYTAPTTRHPSHEVTLNTHLHINGERHDG